MSADTDEYLRKNAEILREHKRANEKILKRFYLSTLAILVIGGAISFAIVAGPRLGLDSSKNYNSKSSAKSYSPVVTTPTPEGARQLRHERAVSLAKTGCHQIQIRVRTPGPKSESQLSHPSEHQDAASSYDYCAYAARQQSFVIIRDEDLAVARAACADEIPVPSNHEACNLASEIGYGS